MRILVLGSTGFIGKAVTDQLLRSGHQVVSVVPETHWRDERTEVATGDLAVPESLRAAVTPDIDAVVHVAAPLGDWTVEGESVRGMLESLGSADKVFLYVSGTWVLGKGSAVLTEASPHHPIALVKGRETVESIVLHSEVTGVVLRPGIAFGRGGGIPGMFVDWAREHGRGRYVGDADVTWPVVHVEDLARLVELALVDPSAAGILHGVAQESVRTADIAAAADVAAGGAGAAQPWSESDAAAVLGPEFAEALATSQAVRSDRARKLGWTPVHTDIVRELTHGSYAAVRQDA